MSDHLYIRDNDAMENLVFNCGDISELNYFEGEYIYFIMKKFIFLIGIPLDFTVNYLVDFFFFVWLIHSRIFSY